MKIFTAFRLFWFGFLLMGKSCFLGAQPEPILINLSTVLELGGANNLNIIAYQRRHELTIAELIKTKEWWLPDLYAGTTLHQLWGAAMNTDGEIFTDLDRQNFFGGIGLNLSWDFGSKPYQIKSGYFKMEAARHRVQSERNKALLEIITAYYDFLTEQLKFQAYDQLIREADTLARQFDLQVEAGLQYQSVALLAQSNYRHFQIEKLNAQLERSNKSAALIRLLNLDPSVEIIPVDSVLAPLELVPDPSLEPDYRTVYSIRPEIRDFELRLEESKTDKKMVTTGLLLPEFRISSYYSYFGEVFSPVYATSAINASLWWRIPLGRLLSGGDLKRANSVIAIKEVELEQMKSTIHEEIVQARSQSRIAHEQMEIAEEASRLAYQALRQSLERQQLGTVLPLEIMQAQEMYIKTSLDHLRAVADYNKAQYRWWVGLGNNL